MRKSEPRDVALDDRRACAVIAIPATNEAGRIEACLAALAMQRDTYGSPVPAGQFEILIFANNCTDATSVIVSAFAHRVPHPVHLVNEKLPPHHANAGWARKRAMDLASGRLIEIGRPDGTLLTTDADSCVSSTWFTATMKAISEGADCVAGYVDAHPGEMMQLSPAFVNRGRREDRYLRLVAEICALSDPRPHDPWPNHRVSSGASLAVTLAAYVGIGGLPPRAVGEDAALTEAMERAGYKVRHAMDVLVSTSCRFDGRAKGGAADTMHYRHDVPEAPCDDSFEPALAVARRALYKGKLRHLHEDRRLAESGWQAKLRLGPAVADELLSILSNKGFLDFWAAVEHASPVLRQGLVLRPSDLPRQIERAEAILRLMRHSAPLRLKNAQDDMSSHEEFDASVAA